MIQAAGGVTVSGMSIVADQVALFMIIVSQYSRAPQDVVKPEITPIKVALKAKIGSKPVPVHCSDQWVYFENKWVFYSCGWSLYVIC